MIGVPQTMFSVVLASAFLATACSQSCGKGALEEGMFVLAIDENVNISAADVLVVTADGEEVVRGTAADLVVDRTIRGPYLAEDDVTEFDLSRVSSGGMEILGSGEAETTTSETAEGGVCRVSTVSEVEVS